MDNIRVLLVEDETTLAMIIKDTLDAQGFEIATAANGEEGLKLFPESKPDVLVADVMMPKIDGFEMVRRIRKTDQITPVLFLTARSAVNDVVKGFELGANDYLKKPFGMQELMVRIKALAKRTGLYQNINHSINLNKEIEIGQYQLNPKTEKLIYGINSEELSHRETEILRMLAEKKDSVVETKDILLQLWGDDSFFNTRSLQVFITKLRHKLSKDKNIRIINVRGVGYKLIF
ncbi:response regulator transcription factor [Prevotella sp.]|uniref:response regulator transcription factor n=1 Tax=Prevotella sp. TaxID=59823 RepID=UPI0026477F2F|nr:response regulator transcription factor [Prevotella sp.]MDN5554142.1 response regulator transcription factor [Prevotella sp.]